MRCILCILIFAQYMLLVSCKKVGERSNAEKNFTLYFADSQIEASSDGERALKLVPFNACFDMVWGKGRPPLSSCSNYAEGFKLPLNITTSSSRFYFNKGDRKDSITVFYRAQYEAGGEELEVVYLIDSIKTSFPMWTTRCIEGVTPICKGNEAYYSATVY